MNIGIVGLGLIGGSIGLKLQSLNHTIYGVTNNKSNKNIASARKLATYVSCNLGILDKCSLIILALPIKELICPSKELIEAIPKEAVLTDVGSVKEPIVNTWEKIHPLFVGSHPMAGTEKRGVNSGFESLLDYSKWIITPTKYTNQNAIKILTNLVKSMNCEILQTIPKEHDKAVALISHLPIFISSCLLETSNINRNKSLLQFAQKIASTGFEDTTRVGGGNPYLGLDLAKNNQANLLESIKMFKNNMDFIERNIRDENWELVYENLEKSNSIRRKFCK